MSSDGPPLKGQFDGILPGNPEEAVKLPGRWLNMLFEKGSDEEQQSFSAPFTLVALLHRAGYNLYQ